MHVLESFFLLPQEAQRYSWCAHAHKSVKRFCAYGTHGLRYKWTYTQAFLTSSECDKMSHFWGLGRHEDEEMEQLEHKHIEVIAGLSFRMDKL